MKKLLLVSTVLFGAVAASQAGVSFHIGLNLPFPPLPVPVVVTHRAPVVVAAPPTCSPYAVISAPVPVCAPPQVVVAAPPCEVAPVVIAPRPVYYPSRRYGYAEYPGYGYGGHYHRGYRH